jgi:hypothetical protein
MIDDPLKIKKETGRLGVLGRSHTVEQRASMANRIINLSMPQIIRHRTNTAPAY